MIRRLVRQMLTAQVFSALTVSLCLLIDNIMISRFLGEEAIAAYGLSNPVLLIIGALGTLMSSGIQMACSKSLGRGSQEETNAGYSTAIVLTLTISCVFMAIVLLFRSPLAAIMGAGNDGSLFDQTRDYLAGFSIGAPGSMGALVLIPFMQIAGQSGLLIAAVLGMTISDIALDLMNVYVFHAGMFGMGLASSISYYVAMIIGCVYFLSPKCVFRFSWKLVSAKKAIELFKGGIPAGFNMAASVILIFVMNQVFKAAGGNAAVAAYTVVMTIGNASNCITTGIGGVSLTLSSIFYNEEDRTSLGELIRLLCRYSVILGLSVGVLLLVFAPSCVAVFITDAGETRSLAILGLRIFAAGLIPCCINNALKNAYQATGRIALTENISLAEGAVLPAAAGFVISMVAGYKAAYLFFVTGELLTLGLISLYIRYKTGRLPWQEGAYLMLNDDFGAAPGNILEADIATIEEVADISRQAEEFCLSKGQNAKVSSRIALCIEEMAGNTIQHGFAKDEKRTNQLSLRLLKKNDSWILRFRDNCKAFDPVHYVPDKDQDALGLRLVLAIAEEAKYTYSLNLNNLMLKLPANE